jgi:hypothetical protein
VVYRIHSLPISHWQVFTFPSRSSSSEIIRGGNFNFTVIITADIADFRELSDINNDCRVVDAKLVACDVRGVCGYVFNDFLEHFEVLDPDGEVCSEVRCRLCSLDWVKRWVVY